MKKILLSTLLLASINVSAADLSVKMTDLDTGKIVGTISAEQTKYGVVFTLTLQIYLLEYMVFMFTLIHHVVRLKKWVKLF